MAKDKNLGKQKSRFEVRGGVINEFEFNQGHGQMTEEERDRFARREEEQALREGESNQPQDQAARVEQIMAEAHEKAAKNLSKKGAGKPAKPAKATARKGVGGAKKSAAKKGRTGGAGKGSAKKAAGKITAKKAAGKKGASKPGRASATKSGKGGASKKGGTAKKGSAAKKGGARRR